MDKELRILILEDAPSDAELLERELRKGEIPFSSKLVETREGFLKELIDFAPDVILSDYKLPQFDGMAALELTKELSPIIPFIIVTGSMNEETAVECMKAGAVDYVIKDHLVRIVPAVKRALELKKIREEKTKLEEALWNSAREWRTTFDAVNYGISLLDSERKIIRCNKAFAELLGKPFSEIIGRNCCQVINTPTPTLPHRGGGNFGSPSISPPLAGGGWGEGDKKANSYTMNLSTVNQEYLKVVRLCTCRKLVSGQPQSYNWVIVGLILLPIR